MRRVRDTCISPSLAVNHCIDALESGRRLSVESLRDGI